MSGMLRVVLVVAALLAGAPLGVAADPAARVDALLAAAEEAKRAGRYPAAIADLEEADRLAGELGDTARRAAVLGSLGGAHLARGDLDAARAALEDSLRLAQDETVRAASWNDLGVLRAREDDLEAAEDAFAQSVRRADEAERSDLAAAAAINAARALIERARIEDATPWLRRARTAVDAQTSGTGKAKQFVALGRALARAGAVREAFDAYQDAARLAERGGDRRLESYARGYLAELYETAGRHDDALVLARRATFLAQGVDAPEALYRWQWQTGRLLAARGEVDAAISAYLGAVGTLDELRADLLLAESRSGGSGLRATVEPVYLELADLLLRRAAATVDRANSQADLRTARRLVERFRAAELEDYFRDDCVAELEARVRPIDRLEAGTAAVYPILLPERTVLLLSLPSGLVQVPLALPREVLTADVRALRRFLEKRTTRQYLPLARRVHDRLIGPIEPHLERASIDTLVFIPAGPLRTIPIAALHDGERFLIDRYAVATSPGLDLLDPKPIATAEMDLMLNGLTEAVQGFPPLPHVERELEAIHALYGGVRLQNETFVVPELRDSLAETPFSVVHIASHGEFKGNPEDSFILTYDGRLDMDGLERFIKLSRFREEPVELLTLSACRTAAGDDRAALGLAGVAVKAGARSALATLWFINDQASSLLVSEFYRRLGEVPTPTKAKALQAAQRVVKEDPRYRHPAYWSPFLIIGNWL